MLTKSNPYIESDCHAALREIVKKLNENHIKRLGLVKKLDMSFPHQLNKLSQKMKKELCTIILFEDDHKTEQITTKDSRRDEAAYDWEKKNDSNILSVSRKMM
ncbi:hypothetical protein ABEB36_000514 [Hypothenemus hampei]|uniref:Uncharacterized protein n=1 Tax=Hypothenemus hampei TaxID=57062 RepID=A0ABD1FBH2_HYPHA